jgi:hypothetical protein
MLWTGREGFTTTMFGVSATSVTPVRSRVGDQGRVCTPGLITVVPALPSTMV